MNERSAQSSSARETEAAGRFAIESARVLADSKCENVVVLDVRGLSPVADYLVVGTGTSELQMRSVADDLKDLAQQEGEPILDRQGRSSGQWLVVDFVDVVVHLFNAHLRSYYDLESLWSDGRRVDWQAALGRSGDESGGSAAGGEASADAGPDSEGEEEAG